MRPVDVLRHQARVLRALADDATPRIKEELLTIAEQCDQLAVSVARAIADRLLQPIGGKAPAEDAS